MTAHVTFHFAIGMTIASIMVAPWLLRTWKRRGKLSRPLAIWLLFSVTLGAFAMAPSILHQLGAPDTVLSKPWANIFLLFPWINRHVSGGMLIGEFMIIAIFTLQYITILLAIRSAGLPNRNALQVHARRVHYKPTVPA